MADKAPSTETSERGNRKAGGTEVIVNKSHTSLQHHESVMFVSTPFLPSDSEEKCGQVKDTVWGTN